MVEATSMGAEDMFEMASRMFAVHERRNVLSETTRLGLALMIKAQTVSQSDVKGAWGQSVETPLVQ